MARIRMYSVKASGMAPKRGAESGKRKQPPAKSSERCPSHAVRGACEWGAPCCKQRNAVRTCWASIVSSTVRPATGASITVKTHQNAVTRVLLCAAVLCDACAIEWGGWFFGGVQIWKKWMGYTPVEVCLQFLVWALVSVLVLVLDKMVVLDWGFGLILGPRLAWGFACLCVRVCVCCALVLFTPV